jgi:hypothetical protein
MLLEEGRCRREVEDGKLKWLSFIDLVMSVIVKSSHLWAERHLPPSRQIM